MNKKAFTIVELSIVLVVIGIIAGMALKAKTIVDTAKMRTNVAKIERIRSAVGVMMAQFEDDLKSFERDTVSGGLYDSNILINKGLLKASDLDGVTSGTGKWAFYNCDPGLKGETGHDISGSYDGANICIRHTELSPMYYCSVEKFMDDEDQTYGFARSAHGAAMANIKIMDCDNLSIIGLEDARTDMLMY
jgi:prepilin-type N-terminal cleavage/methylation domain-containing protein